MGEAIAAKEGESPGGERASQLSSLEARAEVASFSKAQAQDMAAADDLINQLYKQATKHISDLVHVFRVSPEKMKKGKKALAKQPERGWLAVVPLRIRLQHQKSRRFTKEYGWDCKIGNALGKAGADMGVAR